MGPKKAIKTGYMVKNMVEYTPMNTFVLCYDCKKPITAKRGQYEGEFTWLVDAHDCLELETGEHLGLKHDGPIVPDLEQVRWIV